MKVTESLSAAKVSYYSKKDNSRSVFIEGFANRFKEDGRLLIDRGNDLIQPAGWDVTNFASNAIILFNHDRDQPVGRAMRVEKNDDGLFIKVKMSDSDHPEIKRVRDLVKDGTLKAFSVGFNPREMAEEDIEGKAVNMIKTAELLEVSIVSLPMAERSLFNVTAKHLADIPYEMAKQVCLGEIKLLNDEGDCYTEEAIEIINNFKQDTVATAEDGDVPEDEVIPEPPEPKGKAPSVSSQPPDEPTSLLLDQVKETNTLLSKLISEIKSMSAKLDRPDIEKADDVEEPEMEVTENTDDDEAAADEEAKKLKQVDDIYAECDRILRKHGI